MPKPFSFPRYLPESERNSATGVQTYYDFEVHCFNHHTTRTPHKILWDRDRKQFKSFYHFCLIKVVIMTVRNILSNAITVMRRIY